MADPRPKPAPEPPQEPPPELRDKQNKPYVLGEILTYTGRRVHPTELRPEDIDPIDIAHALSCQCRFTGHCREFYSVSQHSVYVSQLVPRAHALAGLLHDASEAYLLDLASPIKNLPEMVHFRVIEARIMAAVATRFGLTLEALHHPEVKAADKRILRTEARDLMPRDAFNLEAGECYPLAIVPLVWWEAKCAWLDRYHILTGKAP